MTNTNTRKYYYGNAISDYGMENGYVDYRAFASCFDAVLNNDIMSKTYDIGYWEQVSGFVDNSEEIDELQEKIDDLYDSIMDAEDDNNDDLVEELEEQKAELEEEKEELEREQDEMPEVYQWYIVSDSAISYLKENNEIVYYNEELDLNLWGVTHWGTSWDYVLTDIKIDW